MNKFKTVGMTRKIVCDKQCAFTLFWSNVENYTRQARQA